MPGPSRILRILVIPIILVVFYLLGPVAEWVKIGRPALLEDPADPRRWKRPAASTPRLPHFGPTSGSVLYTLAEMYDRGGLTNIQLLGVSNQGRGTVQTKGGKLCRGAYLRDVFCGVRGALWGSHVSFSRIGRGGWTRVVYLGRPGRGHDVSAEHLIVDAEGEIQLYRTSDLRLVRSYPPLPEGHGVKRFVWSPDGSRFAAESREKMYSGRRSIPDGGAIEIVHGHRDRSELYALRAVSDDYLFSENHATPLIWDRGQWIVGFAGGLATCDPETNLCEVLRRFLPSRRPIRAVRESEDVAVVLVHVHRKREKAESQLARLDLNSFRLETFWTAPPRQGRGKRWHITDIDHVEGI